MKNRRARLRILHLGSEGQLLAVSEGLGGGSRALLGDALRLGSKAIIVSLRRATSLRSSSTMAARLAHALRVLDIRLHDVLIHDRGGVTSLRALRML